jgi:small neutral amino acid transporter SnatA (MarC family)
LLASSAAVVAAPQVGDEAHRHALGLHCDQASVAGQILIRLMGLRMVQELQEALDHRDLPYHLFLQVTLGTRRTATLQ